MQGIIFLYICRKDLMQHVTIQTMPMKRFTHGRHIQRSGNGHQALAIGNFKSCAGNSTIRIIVIVDSTRMTVVSWKCCRRQGLLQYQHGREMSTGRFTYQHNFVGISSVGMNVLFGPRQRRFQILNLLWNGPYRKIAIIHHDNGHMSHGQETSGQECSPKLVTNHPTSARYKNNHWREFFSSSRRQLA